MKISPSRQQIVASVLIAFFVSGFTGLVYEILWVRDLTKYVGGSTFSVTLVLTVFMAGLALGSWLAGRFVDRIKDTRDLVRLYGIIQIAIGLYAGCFPFIIRAFVPIYALLYRALGHSLVLYGSAAGMLSIALLIVPTTLMGATLPALSRYYIDGIGRTGTRMGLLYGINTIGAALGSLICGVVFLRWLGAQTTLIAAVATNIVIGLAFLGLLGFGSRSRTGFLKDTTDAVRSHLAPPRFAYRGLVVILAVSGACSMAYEVVWTKLLALLVGPTTYSFTLVLFTFITGLGLGSFLFGRLADRVKRPAMLLVGTQLLAAAAALACGQIMGNSQVFFAKLLYVCRGNLLLLEALKGATVFLLMLPATLLLGGVFPTAARAEAGDARDVGSIVGRLYMFNTVGAVIGSLAAGFMLIPLLGKANSLSLLAAIQTLAAVLVGCSLTGLTLRRKVVIVGAGSMLLAMALVFPKWDIEALTRGKYHRFKAFANKLEDLSFTEALLSPGLLEASVLENEKTVFLEDGIGGFVSVVESVSSIGTTNVFLQISGKTDASSHGDLATMTLTGQIPMLLHPDAKSTMVVGLASGISTGEMLDYPIERLDILEISPEVVRACRHFDRWNSNVLDDPRANVILQDARTHITLTDRIYDVIISEPSNPWMAGVANLFTREYFEDVRDHLAPDGLFVQWYHTYQTDWDSFSLVARTLTSVFPKTCIIKTSTTGSDYLLIAFQNPERQLADYLQNVPRGMEFGTKSQNMVMRSPEVLLPLVVAENTADLCEDGPLHTDNHPLLEFTSLREFYSGGSKFFGRLMARARLSSYMTTALEKLTHPSLRLDFMEFMASMNIEPFGLAGLPADADQELLSRHRAIMEQYAAKSIGHGYDRIIGGQTERDIVLATHEPLISDHISNLTESRSSPKALALAYFDLGKVHSAREEWSDAAAAFQRSVVLFPHNTAVLAKLAATHDRLGDYGGAAQVYERFAELRPRSGHVVARLATAHLRMGNQGLSRALFERALELDPDCAPALTAIGSMKLNERDNRSAIQMLERAIRQDATLMRAHQNLALALLREGRVPEALQAIDRGLRIRPDNRLLIELRAHTIRGVALPSE